MGLILATVIMYSPEMIFNGLVLLVIMGGLYEFSKLALPKDQIYRETTWIFGIAVASTLIFLRTTNVFLGVVVTGMFIVSLLYMKHATTLEGVTSRIGLTLFGALYLGATLPFWALLRELPHGKALIFMGVAATAMTDTFAMFGGKLLGRHKFAALTSPNKTMEGFFAGFVGSVLTAYVVRTIGFKDLPILHVIILGVAIGFIGPFGDLIESLIKRDFHVKDSGNIIPGHGGFLDRLDAMIFVAPFMYLYAKTFLQIF